MNKKQIVGIVLLLGVIVLVITITLPGIGGKTPVTTTNPPVLELHEDDMQSSDEVTQEEDNSKSPDKESESTKSELTTEEQNYGLNTVSFDDDVTDDYKENHTYCVAINRQENVVTVYGKDSDGNYTKPVRAMLCSCGKPGGNDTPAGTFKTADRIQWLTLVNDTYAQYTTRINGQIWFHSVPYSKMSPDTLKAEEYNKLGNHASLGCVRLNVEDAKWIFDNLEFNTIIKVYDSDDPGPLGKPEGLKLDVNDARSVWDPTDPDSKNPWKGE